MSELTSKELTRLDLYKPENVLAFLRSNASESIAGKQYAYAADEIESLRHELAAIRRAAHEPEAYSHIDSLNNPAAWPDLHREREQLKERIRAAHEPPLEQRPLSAVQRLHNICDAMSEHADDSPFTREEWERVDKTAVEQQNRIRSLEAEVSTLRDHLAEVNRLMSLNVAEVERLRSPQPTASALDLARRFHEVYERLAPSFGYETRTETRVFDSESKNGRLMVAVCAEIRSAQPSAPECGACDTGLPCSNQYAICSRYGGRPHTSAQPPEADLVACARVFHEAYCPSCPDHPCGLGDVLANIARSALTKGGE